MPKYRTWVELDEQALIHNIRQLQSLLRPETRFCAVLKADAYGHGLLEVAQIAAREGVDAFAVDHIDDALRLREHLPSALILLIGYTLHERLADAIAANIHVTVSDRKTLELLETIASAQASMAHVHVKLDTGMSRQGVLPEQLEDLLAILARSQHVVLDGFSTHFADIDNLNDPSYALMQCELFEKGMELVQAYGFNPEWIHCAKSAATILYPDTHGTLVRVGIALYGIWPSPDVENGARKQGVKCDLRPVLAWKTRIAQIKSLPAGTAVGYERTETLRRGSRIAVLPVGYFDGYDRKLSSLGEVLISGYRCKVIGRVCMNMIVVDVSSVPNVEPELEVTLLGRGGRHFITAQHLAKWIQTNPYEVVTRIHSSIPRIPVSNYEPA